MDSCYTHVIKMTLGIVANEGMVNMSVYCNEYIYDNGNG